MVVNASSQPNVQMKNQWLNVGNVGKMSISVNAVVNVLRLVMMIAEKLSAYARADVFEDAFVNVDMFETMEIVFQRTDAVSLILHENAMETSNTLIVLRYKGTIST